MRICKSVFGIALAHPIYLGVYVVFLSLLGIFLTGGSTYVDTAGTTYVAEPANLAVVDRDGSALSQALKAYLADMHNVADVADDEFALQDALATNTVDAVAIVPEGFGSDCLAAARAGEELPKVEIAYGGYTQASALAEQQAVQWVRLAGAAAALEPEAGVSRVAELAAAATAERADTEVIEVSSSRGPSYPLGAYLSFSTYTIVCSIVVCVGLVLTKMSEQDVRRRMLVSPTRPWRLSAGVLVACLALVLCIWALTSAVGVISSGALANGVGAVQIALALGAMLAFSLVPLAFAFVLSQLGFREEGLNALGNLGGMVSSFLGGAWVPIALLGDAVQTAALFSPAYWTNDAVTAALTSPSITEELLLRMGTDVGVTLLFAVAFTAVGLALGRARPRA